MDRLEIGKILRPQGIRGEVKAVGITDDLSRFQKLDAVYLDDGPKVRVLSVRVAGGFVYLSLSGIADRDAAERLRGKTIAIDREEAVELAEDTYFIVDVLGCEVVSTRGETLGKVRDVLQHGAADVYVLDTGTMFPFLRDVALEVDLSAKRITVDARRFSEVAVYAD